MLYDTGRSVIYNETVNTVNIDFIYTCHLEINLLLIWGLFVISVVNSWTIWSLGMD